MELNEQQRNAVKYDGEAKNILVVAGAGCGKTMTIIERVADLIKRGVEPTRILPITFTRKAADELKKRLNSEVGEVARNVKAGTFHHFCLDVMKRVPKSFDLKSVNIIDESDQFTLLKSVRTNYFSKHFKAEKKDFPNTSLIQNFISYSRNTCQDIGNYLREYTEINDLHIMIFEEISELYKERKEASGYLDFDDLLEVFSVKLKEKPQLRERITTCFDEVLVDEFQDTNILQYSILKHFVTDEVRLFCVGDPAQSIYSFRGANFENIYNFKETFPNTKTFYLSHNYRSYQEILDLSNWLLKNSPKKFDNSLYAVKRYCDFKPIIADFTSVFDESSYIADSILEWKSNDKLFSDIMVLVRTGWAGKIIEYEFRKRKIPYFFIGGTSIAKSAHVKDVLSLLRIIRNDLDELAWNRYLTLWPGIGLKTAEKFTNLFYDDNNFKPFQHLENRLGSNHNAVKTYKSTYYYKNTTKDCVYHAIENLQEILKDRYDRWNQRLKDLDLLVKVSERFESIDELIDSFTLEPNVNSDIEKLDDDDAVLLITVHSAKGQERPVCFVASATPGTYPHSRSLGNIETEEEERRILYVALTRAKDQLIITRSNDYRTGFSYNTSSTAKGEEYFLADVPEELVQLQYYLENPSKNNSLNNLEDIY